MISDFYRSMGVFGKVVFTIVMIVFLGATRGIGLGILVLIELASVWYMKQQRENADRAAANGTGDRTESTEA